MLLGTLIMHGAVRHIKFRLELCPGPRWGAHSAPPDPLAGLDHLNEIFAWPTLESPHCRSQEKLLIRTIRDTICAVREAMVVTALRSPPSAADTYDQPTSIS